MATRSKDVTAPKSSKPAPEATAASTSSTSSTSTAVVSTATALAAKAPRATERQKMTASTSSSTSSDSPSPPTVPPPASSARLSNQETAAASDGPSPPPSSLPTLSADPSVESPAKKAESAAQGSGDPCALCGARDSDRQDEVMECRSCGDAFHSRCANLPQTPEEGEFFCRWECYATYRKSQDATPKTPLDDFSRLSARVQSILGESGRPRPAQGPPLPPHPAHHPAARDMERPRDRSSVRSNGHSRSSSPYQANDLGEDYAVERPTNGYGREHAYADDGRDRRGPVAGTRLPIEQRAYRSHVMDLTGDELEPPRSPRSRPARPLARPPPDDGAFDDPDTLRAKRPKYPPHDEAMSSARTARRDAYGPPGRHQFAGEGPVHYRTADGVDLDRRPPPGYLPRDSGRRPLSRVDAEHAGRPGSARTRPPAYGGDPHGPAPPDYSQPPAPRSRPSSASRGAPQQPPPGKYNIPWLNPAAFPYGLLERFSCQPDNANGVFRIDLSPVFRDKTMHLYQPEIDFFFRCFESPDVSLVVKGMASELNQYLWAWPFILESCGSETHFAFDHFQFRHQPGEPPDLEYVGELRLSMPAYNAYLERYLSTTVPKDVIVLEDHVTKKPITLVAADNIIALNGLALAQHCAQLYHDLLKSFQWDVFAGGIHCLLQYLAPASRDPKLASPLLQFNFPGARGRLADPGNGTTDQAYQVLVGALELVIFERLEPKDRDAFHRVLRAAGYDADKRPMLLDAHLRVLRDAGFAWSTVLLSDGEFVHVNKGRLHFWRVVEPEAAGSATSPCVFLSWAWVYQGVSQRGISTECWFAIKNVSLCTGGWAFDPRRAIVEAAKCGVAIVRTGQFLSTLGAPGVSAVLRQLAFTPPPPSGAVASQRQEQMVLFLESILPCLDAIVDEELELARVPDDSDDFRKLFDDDVMWRPVDTALRQPPSQGGGGGGSQDYACGICGLELANVYKQCLGCTVHARRRRPNAAYPVFRLCVRCHAQPEQHHFKPRALHGFADKLCSSEGHTGLLPATRRYQAERSYFKCRCAPYVRCAFCGGCESCCCLCHTLFQTRFRFAAPEALDQLRAEVVEVVKRHKQLLLQRQPPPLR